MLEGDICDATCRRRLSTASTRSFTPPRIIELLGGASVTEEYRQRSFAVNVGGTKNLVHAAQAAGVRRFVYTASNSVVMGGEPIAGGDETLPYTERFNDLYTETKVVAERFVLSQNGVNGMLTCSIRPERHLGARRPDDVPQAVRKRRRRPRQGADRSQARQTG